MDVPARRRPDACRLWRRRGLVLAGRRARAVVGGDDLAIDALSPDRAPDGGALVRVRIPRWLPTRAGTEPADVVNVAFWLSPRAVLVQQFDRRGDLVPSCRVLAVPGKTPARAPSAAPAWTRARGGCLDADFHHLTRVDPGPRRLLALHSEGEGGSALAVVRYTPDLGQVAAGSTSSVGIPGSSTVSVRFARDGASLDLVSPCNLLPGAEGAPPASCDAPFARARWNLYTRTLPSGALRLRRADLPPGAALHPAGDRFAWPAGASVCIGEPGGTHTPTCFPLPDAGT
jgi:hypothetical protein